MAKYLAIHRDDDNSLWAVTVEAAGMAEAETKLADDCNIRTFIVLDKAEIQCVTEPLAAFVDGTLNERVG